MIKTTPFEMVFIIRDCMSYPFQFSTLISLIVNQTPKNFGQEMVFLSIFKSVMESIDETNFPTPSPTSISRWVSADRKLPASFVEAVTSKRGEKQIRTDIRELVIDNIADVQLLIYQIIRLVREDCTYSADGRVQLLNYNPSFEINHSDYLAKAIIAAVKVNRNLEFEKQELLEYFSEKPISLQPLGRLVPSVRPFFTGRKKDIEKIHKELLNNRVLFLYGPRGIGKSALAAEYASGSNGFNVKIWLTYDQSLKRTIESIVLPDNERDFGHLSSFERNFRWLQTLGKDILIVLDNFDVLEEDEPLFHSFINCGFSLLITSHVHHESGCEYSVGEMRLDELYDLFCHYYTKSSLTRNQIEELISTAHFHTMVVEMTAKLMQNSAISYEAVIGELRKSVAELALPVNVVLSKDGQTKNAIIQKHLDILFDLSSLKNDELCILAYLSYMPLDGVPENLFSKWANDPFSNSITQLYRLGWINRSPVDNTVRIHPIISEMAHSRYATCAEQIHIFVGQSVQYFKNEQEKDEDISIRIASSIGQRLSDFDTVTWMTMQFENACNLQNRGRKNSALSLMESIAEQSRGIDLPNFLCAFLHYRMGCLKLDVTDYDAALMEFEKALSIEAGNQIAEVGYCSLLVNCLLECSLAFAMKEKRAISSRFMTFAERLLRVLPEKEEKTLRSRLLFKQGEILRLQGKHEHSIESFREALSIRLDIFGQKSLEVGLCQAQIGLAYRKLGDDYMAAITLYKAYSVLDQCLPEMHPNLISVQLSLGIALENLTGKDWGIVLLLDYLAGQKTMDEISGDISVLFEQVSSLMESDPTKAAISRHAKQFSDIIKPAATSLRNLLGKFAKPKASVMQQETRWRSYQFGRNYDPGLFSMHNTAEILENVSIEKAHNVSMPFPKDFMKGAGDYHKRQYYMKLQHCAVDNVPVHLPNKPMGSSDIICDVISASEELPVEILSCNSKWFYFLTLPETSRSTYWDFD